ncbi:hypothetical protein CPEBRM1_ABPJDJAI_00906 [Companilactobacillus paralimentarius]|uniref:hypothetical protein n=1 Tax=Companilactobacillus paralimentarius TaxID=83526 RepID=UPI003850DA9E
MQMNQINLDINKSGQIINEPVVLRVGEEDQTITVNLLKDGQPYTSFTTATFFANKPSGAIVANDPANISNGVITYTVPQALVNEFGKITNAYFLIDGKVSTESFVIAVLQGVNISDDLNDYIPGMSNLNVIYDKWKDKLQTITDELAGIDAPKEVKNVIDNELKNYTDQINELQRRITATEAQLNALVVPVNAVGTNLITNSNFSSGLDGWRVNAGTNNDGKGVVTTDSDGDICVHLTGTGNVVGLYRSAVSFNQNQVTTGSALVKGTGILVAAGLESRPNSNFGTISNGSYSKIGSTIAARSNTNNFGIYFNSVNDVLDIYIKFVKLEKGSIATDYSLNPLEISTNANVTKQIQDSAVGTNLLTNSNFSSGLENWSVNPGDNKDCKATVTTDSDGDTCIHITGTGNVCGIQCVPVKFDQNQITTGSLLVKGTGTLCLIGLNGDRPVSNFGTISTKSYSKVGSTVQASSNTNDFCIYFNPVNGVIDVYVKFAKLEKGSIATDYSLNPLEISTSVDVQTAITNAIKVDVGKTITATDDTGKTVKLKITGIS